MCLRADLDGVSSPTEIDVCCEDYRQAGPSDIEAWRVYDVQLTIIAALVDHPSLIDVVEVADCHAYVFQFMRLAEHSDLLHRPRTAPLT
jgi:hypothetical protein